MWVAFYAFPTYLDRSDRASLEWDRFMPFVSSANRIFLTGGRIVRTVTHIPLGRMKAECCAISFTKLTMRDGCSAGRQPCRHE